ncbi:MAG: T9SS type A sorting domain-containing protein, partial [Bacteroidales bacterium]|nr:T9SS type A sorting domain-containing protein [Bacteroidales bacterium]
FTESVGTHYDIIGLIMYGYGEYSLNYRIPSDIIESTGIGVINGEEVRIYPNPASEMLYIDTPFEFDRVSITDISGKVVLEQTNNNTVSGINISSLAAGSYFIKIEKQNESTFIKFIVE